MLKYYQINIFVRVLKRKMEMYGSAADDILINDYPTLTEEDRAKILSRI